VSEPPRPYRTAHQDRRNAGDQGEEIACQFLTRLGWEVVSRNIYFRVGEVDIWARDGSQWVVVEVRSRWSGRPGEGLASVTRTKRRRLAKAGALLLGRVGDPRATLRFDVIEVDLRRGEVGCHVRGAFGGDGEP
jgi:putative endonuclease